jgi:integrase
VHVTAYEKRWPIGTRQRVWLDVLLYTGLRRGDAVRLGRQHIREGVAIRRVTASFPGPKSNWLAFVGCRRRTAQHVKTARLGVQHPESGLHSSTRAAQHKKSVSRTNWRREQQGHEFPFRSADARRAKRENNLTAQRPRLSTRDEARRIGVSIAKLPKR